MDLVERFAVQAGIEKEACSSYDTTVRSCLFFYCILRPDLPRHLDAVYQKRFALINQQGCDV